MLEITIGAIDGVPPQKLKKLRSMVLTIEASLSKKERVKKEKGSGTSENYNDKDRLKGPGLTDLVDDCR